MTHVKHLHSGQNANVYSFYGVPHSHLKHIAMMDEIRFQNKSKIKAITSIKKCDKHLLEVATTETLKWHTDLKPQAKVTGGQLPRERSARCLKLQLTLGWQTGLTSLALSEYAMSPVAHHI